MPIDSNQDGQGLDQQVILMSSMQTDLYIMICQKGKTSRMCHLSRLGLGPNRLTTKVKATALELSYRGIIYS